MHFADFCLADWQIVLMLIGLFDFWMVWISDNLVIRNLMKKGTERIILKRCTKNSFKIIFRTLHSMSASRNCPQSRLIEESLAWEICSLKPTHMSDHKLLRALIPVGRVRKSWTSFIVRREGLHRQVGFTAARCWAPYFIQVDCSNPNTWKWGGRLGQRGRRRGAIYLERKGGEVKMAKKKACIDHIN